MEMDQAGAPEIKPQRTTKNQFIEGFMEAALL